MENYSLLGMSYVPDNFEADLIANYPPQVSNDWEKDRYQAYKSNLKRRTLLNQYDKCAYCRRLVEADGYYEPLEHVVAKSLKPQWLLEPRNLIVTCNTCNNLKSDQQTLNDDYVEEVFYPTTSEAFKIFHPHFDKWADHLRYEDDIFLVAVPDSKGIETVRVCKLYRYHVIVNRVKELKAGQQSQAKKIVHRLRNVAVDSVVANHLFEAIDHLLDRMEDKIGFQKNSVV
ncbi:MAG: hypothetical protein V4717_23445 [Bacteroidota bacterium]